LLALAEQDVRSRLPQAAQDSASEAEEEWNETAQYQTWLAAQPNEIREAAREGTLEDAKRLLGDDEVAGVMAVVDEEESIDNSPRRSRS
jgi:hypothetical protein